MDPCCPESPRVWVTRAWVTRVCVKTHPTQKELHAATVRGIRNENAYGTYNEHLLAFMSKFWLLLLEYHNCSINMSIKLRIMRNLIRFVIAWILPTI